MNRVFSCFLRQCHSWRGPQQSALSPKVWSIGLAVLVLCIGCEPTGEANPSGQPTANETSDVDAPVEDAEASGSSEDEKLSVGDKAPDFEVELLGGKTQRLSELVSQSDGPTILLFDRAHW